MAIDVLTDAANAEDWSHFLLDSNERGHFALRDT